MSGSPEPSTMRRSATVLPIWDQDCETEQVRKVICRYSLAEDARGETSSSARSRRTRRRRPMVDNETGRIMYWDVLCEQVELRGRCRLGDQCHFAHSKEENLYHAAKYKTRMCNPGHCHGIGKCSFAHDSSEIRSSAYAKYSFKSNVGIASVLQSEPTRVSRDSDHFQPSESSSASTAGTYRRRAYKRTFCRCFPDASSCDMGLECGFAHRREEIRGALCTPEEERLEISARTDDFFMYKFKTLWCPYTTKHDWRTCVYAHSYQDARRHPGIGYGPQACPHWTESLQRDNTATFDYLQRCPFGFRCPYSHGPQERTYHPGHYRTRACRLWAKYGGCPHRDLCCFVHEEEERRVAPAADSCDSLPCLNAEKFEANFQADFGVPPFAPMELMCREVEPNLPIIYEKVSKSSSASWGSMCGYNISSPMSCATTTDSGPPTSCVNSECGTVAFEELSIDGDEDNASLPDELCITISGEHASNVCSQLTMPTPPRISVVVPPRVDLQKGLCTVPVPPQQQSAYAAPVERMDLRTPKGGEDKLQASVAQLRCKWRCRRCGFRNDASNDRCGGASAARGCNKPRPAPGEH